MKLKGIISADENTTDQPLMVYSAVIKYLRKMGISMGQYITYILT
jgi:hypothetical protein